MRPFLAVLCALACLRAASAAEPAFTPDQRREIVQILRDALKSDPTILRDAVMALRAADQAQEAAEQKATLTNKHDALVANPSDAVVGNPTGDVTLVEFYDPRCQYCRRMLPAVDALLHKDGRIRLVYKDIPVLGPGSVMESRAILAAGRQGGYERMQAALMTNPAQPSRDMISETARKLGLDPARLLTDMDSQAVSHQIEANLTLARALKVEGTPVFVVGDTVIPGAVDQPTLEQAIADARQHS